MAHSCHDVAAARAFHRRRLVAAFVPWRTDDPEDQPPGTVRCVVAGLLVGAVCAAGVGASSLVSGRPQISWVQGGLRVTP